MITTTYKRGRTCTKCKIKIPAEEKHIAFRHQTWRNSSTVYYCAECIEVALNEIGKEELKKIKERNTKLRVVKRLSE